MTDLGGLCHWLLHSVEILGLLVIARDVLKLVSRVDALQVEEQKTEAHVGREEHVRHDETAQLRRDVDAVALRLRSKIEHRRARQPGQLKETLEAGFAPPRQMNDTDVWSPNAPKLPQWASCPACGLQSERCICGGWPK